jgi:hypothetical protein
VRADEMRLELDAAERQVKDLLDRIKSQVSEVADRRQEAAETLKKYEAIQSERASAYDAAAAELCAREDEIAPSVTSDPVWIALKARVDAASKTAGEAEKKSGTSRGRPRAKEHSL